MIAVTLSLLIATQALAETTRSTLVEESHVHDWAVAEDSDGERLLYDRAFQATFRHEGETYPEILVRYQLADGEFTDTRHAVSCALPALASLEIWHREPSGPASPETIRMPQVTFVTYSDPDEGMRALFRFACGDDWKSGADESGRE